MSWSRRQLLGGLGWVGLGSVLRPQRVGASAPADDPPLHEHDRWLAPLQATYRQLIDVTNPVGTSAFNYALTFLYANGEAYRRRDAEVNVVVVLRDRASILALGDALWEKYHLGEQYGIMGADGAPVPRNPHARQTGSNPNLSPAIDALGARGVVVAACATALRTYAGQGARRLSLDPAAARTEWLAGVLPQVTLVPAGILAVNAAQRRGFAYASAG